MDEELKKVTKDLQGIYKDRMGSWSKPEQLTMYGIFLQLDRIGDRLLDIGKSLSDMENKA